MANPFEFIQDVRSEAGKVTWPSRRETMITTVMVLIMVVLAAGVLRRGPTRSFTSSCRSFSAIAT